MAERKFRMLYEVNFEKQRKIMDELSLGEKNENNKNFGRVSKSTSWKVSEERESVWMSILLMIVNHPGFFGDRETKLNNGSVSRERN